MAIPKTEQEAKELMTKYNIKECYLGTEKVQCENLIKERGADRCANCPFRDKCDYVWVYDLWRHENEVNGDDTLLGAADPRSIKDNMRMRHIISVGDGKDNFCESNRKSKNCQFIVIYDIYVDEDARGQGKCRAILNYLMESTGKPILAKCVTGTAAEDFWKKVGYQVNDLYAPDDTWHEVRKGKRDLSWYVVDNPFIDIAKEELW